MPAGGGTGTFADLVATPRVAENLAAQNVTAPNALQSAAFAPIAAGRDVRATGSCTILNPHLIRTQ